MKPLTILLLLSFSMQIAAQKAAKKTGKEPFVRIFDMTGKKVYNGFLTQTTDNSIIAGTRNRPIFKINQHQVDWLKARPVLDSYLNTQ